MSNGTTDDLKLGSLVYCGFFDLLGDRLTKMKHAPPPRPGFGSGIETLIRMPEG